jgi:hypothetical protein
MVAKRGSDIAQAVGALDQQDVDIFRAPKASEIRLLSLDPGRLRTLVGVGAGIHDVRDAIAKTPANSVEDTAASPVLRGVVQQGCDGDILGRRLTQHDRGDFQEVRHVRNRLARRALADLLAVEPRCHDERPLEPIGQHHLIRTIASLHAPLCVPRLSQMEQSRLTKRGGRSEAVLLPLGLVATSGIGLTLLNVLWLPGPSQWLRVVAGAVMCMFAGWIASALWSRSYWHRSMTQQIATWRRITDAIFGWVEDLPVSTEALNQLKVSLEEAVSAESA